MNWTILGPLARISENVPGQRLLAWNVPQSELIHIPEHWLSYPEPEMSLHLLLGLLYIFFFLMATIGNGLVLWVFSAAKSLRTPSNMFVVNLAFCDFMMMLKTPIFIYNSFHRGYALGHLGCQIFAFVGSLSGIAAGMTNACIAYDRYTTIANPLDGKLTRMKAVMMILFVWMYTIPWAVLPLLELWGRFVPEGYLTACTFDYLSESFDNRMFVAVIFTFSYVIPMSMIIYFYSNIVGHVVNHEKALREQVMFVTKPSFTRTTNMRLFCSYVAQITNAHPLSDFNWLNIRLGLRDRYLCSITDTVMAKKMNVESLRSNQGQNSQSAEIRIAKAAITICFLFVAAWTPYAVLAIIGSFGDKALLTPGVTMIPACTCKFVACLDPYVYAISHPRYRIELNKRLPWLAIKESSPSDTQSNATENTTQPPSA